MKDKIPENVIWVQGNGMFYRGSDTSIGDYNGITCMGQAFLRKWYGRRNEFPQDSSPFVIQ